MEILPAINFNHANISSPIESNQKMLANASEELTFQFSEIVERSSHAEENKVESDREKQGEAHITVEKTAAILKIMQGDAAYDYLRSHARNIALQLKNSSANYADVFDIYSLDSDHKYTLLKLTLDALKKSNQTDIVAKLHEEHGALLNTKDAQIANILNVREPKKTAENADEYHRSYFEILEITPSVSTVLSTAVSLGGMSQLNKSIHQMQMNWAKSLSLKDLTQVGTFVLVTRLVQTVQTMIANSKKLMHEVGIENESLEAHHFELAKKLIDLIGSSAPSVGLDNLGKNILQANRKCPNCARNARLFCKKCSPNKRYCSCLVPDSACSCKDSKSWFFSILFRHAKTWPNVVWATEEAKDNMLQHIIRKQQNKLNIK